MIESFTFLLSSFRARVKRMRKTKIQKNGARVSVVIKVTADQIQSNASFSKF